MTIKKPCSNCGKINQTKDIELCGRQRLGFTVLLLVNCQCGGTYVAAKRIEKAIKLSDAS